MYVVKVGERHGLNQRAGGKNGKEIVKSYTNTCRLNDDKRLFFSSLKPLFLYLKESPLLT